MPAPERGTRRRRLIVAPTRRQFLWGAGWVVAGWASGWLGARYFERAPGEGAETGAGAGGKQVLFRGYSLRQSEEFLTSNDEFFVRNHFKVPAAASRPHSEWTISVEGEVDHPFTLRWADLKALEARKLPATLECAGNKGMNGINRPTAGRAWGGASTALWEGVPLAPILRRAGLHANVQEVILEGADTGYEKRRSELLTFARSIPVAAAMADDALLALRMNEEPLPSIHGGPVRAIIPDRFATDSVKWITKIRATSVPFEGFFAVHRYRWGTLANPGGEPLGDMRVGAELTYPSMGEQIPRGVPYLIRGVAWGGSGGIREVVVSTDGGAKFELVEWLDPVVPHCWRRFKKAWTPNEPGPRMLMSRATDATGQSQPLLSQEELGTGFSIAGPDRIQYANNAIQMVPVVVI